ncbi:hypothetical protein ScPMuIL_005700 [Solemya velum]
MACCGESDSFVSPLVKYLLFFFNFVFWLVGGVMVGIGVWAWIEKNRFYHKEIEDIYDVVFDLSIIFLVLGIIIFVLGYAGCIGALRENCFLLKFFYGVMILIFLLEVTGAILVFVFKDQAKQNISEVLQDNVIIRYQDDPDGQSVIDWIQENLYCCGVNGYKDWNKNEYFNCTKENLSRMSCTVPYSCCIDPDKLTPGVPNILCGATSLDDEGTTADIYTVGCIPAFINIAEDNWPIIGGIAIALVVPQLVVICLARMLEGQVLDQRARWRHR